MTNCKDYLNAKVKTCFRAVLETKETIRYWNREDKHAANMQKQIRKYQPLFGTQVINKDEV